MQAIFRNIKTLLLFPLLILPVGMIFYGIGTFLMTPSLVGTSIFTSDLSYIPRIFRGIGMTMQSQAGMFAAISVAWGLSRKSITVTLVTVFAVFSMQTAFSALLPTMLTKEILQEVLSLPLLIYPFNIVGGVLLAMVITLINESKYAEDINKQRVSLREQLIQAIISLVVALILGFVLAYIWVQLVAVLRIVAQYLTNGAIGHFFYGTFSVLLRPLGFTDLLEVFQNYTAIGGAWKIPEPVNGYAYGREAIWLAQLAYNGGKFTGAVQSATTYVYAIFVIPSIALAIINTTFVEHIKEVRLVLLVFIVISVVVGFTFPIEMILLLTTPLLFIFTALIYGILSFVIGALSVFVDIHLITVSGGGITDLLFFGILPGAQKTGAWVLILVGAVSSVVTYYFFYFVIKKMKLKTFGRNKEELILFKETLNNQGSSEVVTMEDKVDTMIRALGGYENIKDIVVSMYRLHIEVENAESVDELPIKQSGAAGIFIVKDDVQIIMGSLTNEYYTLLNEKIEENK